MLIQLKLIYLFWRVGFRKKKRNFIDFENKMKRSYKFVIAVASFSTVGSVYLLGKKEKNLLASWTTNYEPSVKWDSNWDKRDPKSLIHPKSRHASNLAHEQQAVANGEKKSVDDFEINKHSSKATRHLFLIRHGQYEIKASHPDQRVLTQLGIFFNK